MFTAVLFTSLFISQNVLVHSRSSEQIKIHRYVGRTLLGVIFCMWILLLGELPDQDPEPDGIPDYSYDTTMRFPKGIVPYYIETISYDSIIVGRIKAAMDLVEASSCVVFKQLPLKPATSNGSWVHFANPEEKRECVHGPTFGINGEINIIIGYECMMFRYILHAVLHSIGFKDEVSHPHRDQYIRIMWENIQPKYRHLFHIQQEDPQHKVVEYDPMSIMHFHDRAFSSNGAPTIAPRLPGLRIKPSEKLSQLDVMKLRLWFGHECNKRKVGALLEKCKTVFHNSPAELVGNQNENEEEINISVEADKDVAPFVYDMGIGQGSDNAGVINEAASYYPGGVGDGMNEGAGSIDGGYGGAGGTGAMDGGNSAVDGSNGAMDGGNGAIGGGNGAIDGGNGAIDGGNEAMNGGNGAIDGGNSAIDGGNSAIDGGNGAMDGGDGGKDKSEGGVDADEGGGDGDGGDDGLDEGDDGAELEVGGDDDDNAVEDDGERRKMNYK